MQSNSLSHSAFRTCKYKLKPNSSSSNSIGNIPLGKQHVLLTFHVGGNHDFHVIISEHFVVACATIIVGANDDSENNPNCIYKANATAMCVIWQGKNTIIQHP
jgi:hypothetical protein